MTLESTFETLVNPKTGLVLMCFQQEVVPWRAGDLAGFFPEKASELYRGHYAIPVTPEGQIIDINDAPPPAAPAATPQRHAIPDNWREMHHLKRFRLAKQISGSDVDTMDEADRIIEAEVNRR